MENQSLLHLIIPINFIICHENGVRRIMGFVYERFGYDRVYCTWKCPNAPLKTSFFIDKRGWEEPRK